MSVRVDRGSGNHSYQKIRTTIAGKKVRFCVNNTADWIQRHHYEGRFYEAGELAVIAGHFSRRTRYLDVGANIGNHLLYLCTFATPREAVAIEPNPAAIELLEANIKANKLDDIVDTSHLGLGLSDDESLGQLAVPRDNLGGARFIDTSSEEEGIRLSTGDRLFPDRDFDFVKIDVEGMEIRVLIGMSNLLRRCRPTLFVEVDNLNVRPFEMWCHTNGYRVSRTFRRYKTSENYLIVPG